MRTISWAGLVVGLLLVVLVIVILFGRGFWSPGGVSASNPLRGISQETLESFTDCSVEPKTVIEGGNMSEITAYFYLALSDCEPDIVRALYEAPLRNVADLYHPVLGTPLHRIANRNNSALLVEELVAAGVDTETRNRRGNTALFVALERGNQEAVRALIDSGASVNASHTPYQNLYDYCQDLVLVMESWPACDELSGS